ncbi:MAG: NIPSNAP family protein [Oleispira sp.]|nr:NIPSNAP family protein [Oleispira sp.]
MINILVTLEVKDFNFLTLFETKAAEIMRAHGGRIISAFESVRNEDNSGQEVHLLEFPNDASFEKYRADARHIEHAKLRNKAIDTTSIVISRELKNYD